MATNLTAALLLASVLVMLDKDKEGALSPELMVVSREGKVVTGVVALGVAVVEDFLRVGVVLQQQIKLDINLQGELILGINLSA